MIDGLKKIVLAVFLAAVFGPFACASVYGMRAFFADQPVFATVFGSGLEAAKLALVVGSHWQWPGLGFWPRVGRGAVVIGLIGITSAAVLGFMWLSHNVSTAGFQQVEDRRAALEAEASAIRHDLGILENTISHWPDTWVTRRLEEMEKAGYYEKQQRLREILAALEGLAVKTTIEYSGPVFATARVLKWLPEEIAKWYVVWLVLLGEAAGFWLMVLNSRAWGKEETGTRRVGDGGRLPRRSAPRNDTAEMPGGKNAAANMPGGNGRNAGNGKNAAAEMPAKTANMPDNGHHEGHEEKQGQVVDFKVIAENAEGGGKYAGKYAAANMPDKTAEMPANMPAETANMPGGNGRNAGNGKNAAAPVKCGDPPLPSGNLTGQANGEKQEAGRENAELLAIMERHGLAAEDVMRMTGRSKIGTVNQWLRDEAVIPEKALRELKRGTVYHEDPC